MRHVATYVTAVLKRLNEVGKMRTKLSDWTVGESVVFISQYQGHRQNMIVVSVGRKYIGIGKEGSKTADFKFEYTNHGLCYAGQFSHYLYSVDEYELMRRYDVAFRNAKSEIEAGMLGPERWTEENIERLEKIFELILAIKK